MGGLFFIRRILPILAILVILPGEKSIFWCTANWAGIGWFIPLVYITTRYAHPMLGPFYRFRFDFTFFDGFEGRGIRHFLTRIESTFLGKTDWTYIRRFIPLKNKTAGQTYPVFCGTHDILLSPQ
jgi:hypothetical protein